MFGRILVNTNPGFQPFGFAGGHFDHETGLVRFGARDYDPEIGRWLSKDPILFTGGQENLYAYVGNNPINQFDPNGLYTMRVGKIRLILNRQTAAAGLAVGGLCGIAFGPGIGVLAGTSAAIMSALAQGAQADFQEVTNSTNLDLVVP